MFKLFKLVIVGTVCAIMGAAQKSSWGIEQNIMGSVGTSVTFSDATHGFYPMDSNDGGSTVLETTDGGQNWSSSGPQNVAMFLASASKGQNIVANTMFGKLYSNDGGKTFNSVTDYETCQSVRFSQTKVWAPSDSQLSVSSDNGATWTYTNIPQLQTQGRYVAAPSDNVIYISAGEWPQQSPQKDSKAHSLSARWTLAPEAATKKITAIPTFGSVSKKHAESTGQSTTYKMQMLKSVDGGKTFVSQFFSDSLNLYFNAVDCFDEKHCCAAAEGDSVAVFCTNDGESWNQVYADPSSTLSLMGAAYVGPEEIWIGGGNLSQIDMYAYMLHSVDGGKTWTVEGTDIYGQYPNDLSFVSSTQGWASTFNNLQQSGLLQYKNWSQAQKSFLE